MTVVSKMKMWCAVAALVAVANNLDSVSAFLVYYRKSVV